MSPIMSKPTDGTAGDHPLGNADVNLIVTFISAIKVKAAIHLIFSVRVPQIRCLNMPVTKGDLIGLLREPRDEGGNRTQDD